MAFKDIIGHGRAIGMLKGAMKTGRVASSYLFRGEQGIGKRLTALNFIKALNCPSPADYDACDECVSCRKLNAGTHPDFLILEPEDGQIKVEKIRAVEEVFSMKSYEAKKKAVIVDDADAMNPSASNAFLKTLEEPPDESLIVLVTANPDILPDTVRSRCLKVDFTPLGMKDCADVIRHQNQDNADALALLSMGRPGLALRDDLMGKRQGFLDALGSMLEGQAQALWAGKKDIEEWIDMAFVFLRDMALVKTGGNASLLINRDMKDDIVRMSKTLELKGIIDCYLRLSALRGYLRFNLNKSITWNYAGSLLRGLLSKGVV